MEKKRELMNSVVKIRVLTYMMSLVYLFRAIGVGVGVGVIDVVVGARWSLKFIYFYVFKYEYEIKTTILKYSSSSSHNRIWIATTTRVEIVENKTYQLWSSFFASFECRKQRNIIYKYHYYRLWSIYIWYMYKYILQVKRTKF